MSAAHDPLFELGCRNALHFFQAYDGSLNIDDEVIRYHYSSPPVGDEFDQEHGKAASEALWMQYFEDRIDPSSQFT